MNIYHLSLVETILQNLAQKLASLPYIETAINYDLRETVKRDLRTIHEIFFVFFLEAGFLKKQINYCTNEFSEMISLNRVTD
ncbi:hypothetical protein RAH57_13750 [Chryseobacterium sp. CKR4-1]|uniref:hypothetical protein n=1 Tax=Chryseobacterium sp. CKR4-1 TaxID=3068896 RepID=UPI002796AD2C|nr:hypothetical protein [Chryseobacterium sp. CKR4-1]MDQ1805058.1 hypothetical protein [Chryseobacterium sp. CKR4-1]